MGLRNLLSKKEFWKIVMYGIILYIILFLLVLLGLRIYTLHGKSFPVPDFKGLKPERVYDLDKSRGLTTEISDSTYVPY